MFKNFLRLSGYFVAGIAFLVLFYATVIFSAATIGKSDGEKTATIAFATNNQRQIELAQQDIANDNIALAVRRVQSLNELIPDDQAVVALIATLTQQALSAEPTHTLPAPVIIKSGGTPTATPTPLPPIATPDIVTTEAATATPNPLPATPRPEYIEQQLTQIEAAIQAAEWEKAISTIIAFQLSNPAYERFYTDSLLFDAYIGGGFSFTNSSHVTLGINYFEQAQKLGDLPEDAAGQLDYSRSYLKAMSFYGINWSLSVGRLVEICRLAPDFQNSCGLLFNARSEWGDQFSVAGDACAAEEQYRLALQLKNSNDISQKINSEKWKCQRATATPWQADADS